MAEFLITRRRFGGSLAGALALAAFTPALVSTPAFAAKDQVFTGLVSGVGAGGYDVVAYFTDGRALRGSADHAASYNGATWHFANADNKAAFEANPAKYAPQFGGYCAWAVSQGYTAKGDPNHWSVVDGKLYLNYNGSVKSRWEADIPGHIASGRANWPGVLE